MYRNRQKQTETDRSEQIDQKRTEKDRNRQQQTEMDKINKIDRNEQKLKETDGGGTKQTETDRNRQKRIER